MTTKRKPDATVKTTGRRTRWLLTDLILAAVVLIAGYWG